MVTSSDAELGAFREAAGAATHADVLAAIARAERRQALMGKRGLQAADYAACAVG